MHLWVLRELAEVIARPLSVIFGQLWGTRYYGLISLTSIPGKVMKQFIVDAISKHVEEKKVVRSSQHGFTKGGHAQPTWLLSVISQTAGLVRGKQ